MRLVSLYPDLDDGDMWRLAALASGGKRQPITFDEAYVQLENGSPRHAAEAFWSACLEDDNRFAVVSHVMVRYGDQLVRLSDCGGVHTRVKAVVVRGCPRQRVCCGRPAGVLA